MSNGHGVLPGWLQLERSTESASRAPDRGRGVDALVEHDHVDLVFLQVLGQGDLVLQGAAEPISFVTTS
jgi:hypothetical protein